MREGSPAPAPTTELKEVPYKNGIVKNGYSNGHSNGIARARTVLPAGNWRHTRLSNILWSLPLSEGLYYTSVRRVRVRVREPLGMDVFH